MERFQTLFVVAGIGFFGFAFFAMGVGSIGARGLDFDTIEDMAQTVIPEFEELAATYPEQFLAAYGEAEANPKTFADALRTGRDVYVAEACWHCHSQFIRPVGNEYLRFGETSTPNEGYNELHMPVLYGTRRVGPDLSREGGKRPNGWHVAHFWEPMEVVPSSVMPSFAWLYQKSGRFEVLNSRKETVGLFASEQEASQEMKKRNNRRYSIENAEGSKPFHVQDSYTERVVGRFASEEEARAEADGLNAGLQADKPFISRAEMVPNKKGLSLIAYIQFLGTWSGEVDEDPAETSEN